jgi:hypothetical protein
MGEMRILYTALVGESEGKRTFGHLKLVEVIRLK